MSTATRVHAPNTTAGESTTAGVAWVELSVCRSERPQLERTGHAGGPADVREVPSVRRQGAEPLGPARMRAGANR
jgi:hypothetical protein